MTILFEFLATCEMSSSKNSDSNSSSDDVSKAVERRFPGDFGLVNGILEQKIQQQRGKKTSSPPC